jgi:hypothetical protein
VNQKKIHGKCAIEDFFLSLRKLKKNHMKTHILFVAVILFGLISCQNQDKKQSESANVEKTEQNQDEKQSETTESETLEPDYLIAEGKVGHLRAQNDEIKLNPGETIIHETRMMPDEVEPYEAELDHVINEDNDTLITINDYGFWVFSPQYHTESGLHVNKTMADFYGLYADAKIYYSYVSGEFWMETESMENVYFGIEKDFYKGEDDWLMQSDMVEIEPQYMDETARITQIRVY